MSHRLFALLTILASAAPLFAHDDDGKILDRRPCYAGLGYRSGAPIAKSGSTPSMNLLGFPSSGIELLAWLPCNEFGGNVTSANSCFGYTSPSGREYAIIGLSAGTGFVDITNPGDPTILTMIHGPTSLWRDVKVYQSYCYAASEGGGGIQVIDMSQIDSGVVTLIGAVTGQGSDATHTISLDPISGFLYRDGGSGNGLRIYSLANPASPSFVGEWQTKYVHESSVYTYTSGPYSGKQIAFCCGGYNGGWSQTGLDILDVTNKSNIQVLSHITYNGAAYCHQGWLTSDKHYFYIDDEKDEGHGSFTKTYVLDVSNLSNPQNVNVFDNGNTSIGHNLYVKGNRLFEANYRSGLRVFDNTDPVHPTEIAYYDTWPDDDDAYFNGLWNNYPYFPSGTVIGSDIEKGLFVWWVGGPQLDISFPNGLPANFDPLGDTVQVQINAQSGYAIAPGSEALAYDLGAGWQETALVALGNGLYDAPIPSSSCASTLRWYVKARTTAGVTWNAPQGSPVEVESTTYASSINVQLTDDMEVDSGWIAGDPSDTATDGFWVRMDPYGTAAQADSDHTPGAGRMCWVTGATQIPDNVNANDVDGGHTTLTSPKYDLTSYTEPAIGYWRWYNNAIGPHKHEDVFTIQVTNDDGANWTNVEVVGPTGSDTIGGWNFHMFRVSDFVAPTASVRVRFIADDSINDSTVEAGVDDFEIAELVCPGTPQVYCTAKPNSLGCSPSVAASGHASASSSQALDIGCTQLLNQKFGLLFYGSNPSNAAFQGGTLCVTLPITRTHVQTSGGASTGSDCSGSFHFDFNAYTQSGADPSLVAGAKVCCQYWSRDPQDPTGFSTSLSDALSFTIEP